MSISLYTKKKDCCGCSACMNICPNEAITMKSDEDGFIYPTINNNLCVKCGLCKSVCTFQNKSDSGNQPIATYAAINKNKSILTESASGGVFAALASIILEKNGVVFGCAYNNEMIPVHICINNPLDIKKLQGSKYVQSNINSTYIEAKKYLEDCIWVLFTGTPCQIAGLKSYLGKDYDNLITADIICHGVPSAAFFAGYIKFLEERLKGKVLDFKFRDKSNGWGLQARCTYQARNGGIHYRIIYPYNSYFYSYFLKGEIYRESCYECKYACGNREGDFTMGDYWGIEKAHPEIVTKEGVSVLLLNSKKGMSLIDEIKKNLHLTESTFELAKKQNEQLNRPTAKSSKREFIFKTWREGGYKAVANEYYNLNKKNIVLNQVKMLVPYSIKTYLKRILAKCK